MSLQSKNLYLGSGGQEAPEFLTTDLEDLPGVDMLLDASLTPYPFKDGQMECIYSSHMIEHIDHWLLPEMVKEWYRILKDKGEIVIDCPDLEGGIALWMTGKQEEALKLFYGDPKDREAQRHKWGWTYERLEPLFKDTGFSEVFRAECTDYHLTEFNIPTFRLKAVK